MFDLENDNDPLTMVQYNRSAVNNTGRPVLSTKWLGTDNLNDAKSFG